MDGIGWSIVFDFIYLSIFLLTATAIRARVRFVQRLLIPNAVLGGAIGFILCNKYMGIIALSDNMGGYIYHLLNITFAALALGNVKRHAHKEVRGGAISTGIMMTFVTILQLIVGTVLTIFFINTWYPDMFPTFGTLMMMGYACGPGQAYSIGLAWEPLGFIDGSGVGLAFGAVGFLWAFLVGIIMINVGLRRNKAEFIGSHDEIHDDIWTGIISDDERRVSAGRLVTSPEAIDTLSLQVALCLIVYLCGYLVVLGGTKLMSYAGMGAVADGLWGFMFIIVVVVGMLVRSLILDPLGLDRMIDSGIQTRISGLCVDYLVVASLAAIPIVAVSKYAVPIAVIALAGGAATVLAFVLLPKHVWRDSHLERTVLCYGTLTGTMSSGLSLCRVIDPNYESPAMEHYIYGMSLCLMLLIPVLLVVSIPLIGYSQGGDFNFALVMGVLIMGEIILFMLWHVLGLWKKDEE